MAVQPGLGRLQAGAHRRLLERLAAVQATVAQALGQGREHPAELAHRSILTDQQRQDLQRCQHAVAGGGEVAHDQMAGLLAAQIVAALAHLLDHVAIADLGAVQLEPLAGQEALEAEIGHDRRDHAVALELASALPLRGEQA